MQSLRLSLILIAVAAAETKVSVILPGNYVEFSQVKPACLPRCTSNTWAIQGSTYDGFASCTSNNKTRLSINPFRCAKYASKPSKDGLYGCDSCYYGSHAVNDQVFPSLSANPSSNVFYVREIFTGFNNLASCLYTADVQLSSICDYIMRDSINPQGSNATCVKGSTILPFAKPLRDASPCKHYDVVNGQLVCI